MKGSENLEVPVTVTLPIPESINPDFLCVLHYHANGEVEEITWPHLTITEEDGKYYVTMVLTSFSDFVLTETTTETTTDTATITITRLFNPATGEHLLASSDTEISTLTSGGWSVDGVMCTMPTSGTPIYRLYNPTSGEHLYTMVQDEIDTLTAGGWNVDGVIAYSADSSGTPIYRLYNSNAAEISSHLLSTSQAEIDSLVAAGWTVEGIALYAA